ncbi:MAG: N-ethylmaleimide reductase [Paraglaciecola sp.]|jgi:N-ethylmaleimide reductase
MSKLFDPMQLGDVVLANRIIMAPLTRGRAEKGHVPSDIMTTYYAQRASAGLIIAEATMISEGNSAFIHEPGIYCAAQITAWQKVTQAVHQEGGKIFLQLWHGGRTCHSSLNDGAQPVAPSAIAIDGEIHTPDGKKTHEVPRELSADEIPTVVQAFRQAAINAKQAGFDGVEVHGANGYLLDQFLRASANKRSDEYGGTLENRARLLLEVVDAVVDVIGAGRVGLRISPLNSSNSMRDDDPKGLVEYLVKQLNGRNLAYLHLMRADFSRQQHGDVLSVAREHYTGNLIGNMGYNFAEASQALEAGTLDAVAFGKLFISNPDLPRRFAQSMALTAPDPTSFYTHGPRGYIDYPKAS